jgi:hypothetical protein
MHAVRLLLLLCVIVIGLSGCSATQHRHDAYGARGPVALATSGGGGEGLQEVGRDEALLFIYAFVAVAIVCVVIVDVILLPIGCQDRTYYFPCCRALISCCH